MNENSPLKIAIFISLGLHLLFLGVASGLFGIPCQASASYVRVRLLPIGGGGPTGPCIQSSHPKQAGTQDNIAAVHPSQSRSVNTPHENPRIISERPEVEKVSPETKLSNGNETVPLKTAAFTEGKALVSPASISSGEISEGSPSGGNHEGGSGTGGSGKGAGILGNIFGGDGGTFFIQPKVIKNPKPIYPEEARRKGIQGEVILRIEVLPNGRAGQIEIKKSSGHGELDRSALVKVKQDWKFTPAKKGEEIIKAWFYQAIEFQLE